MKLRIDTIQGVATLDDGQPVVTDRFYPMPDGYKFIVRALTGNAIMIEIKQGKRVVQRGTVRFLSAVLGRHDNGKPRRQLYSIELHPDKPIYPIADLVDQLMAAGIEHWQIAPVFEDQFDECVANHSSPQMWSDGNVTVLQLPERDLPGDDSLLPSNLYRVSGATWAIMSHEDRVSHVYLWMGAEADAVMDAIEQIRTSGRVLLSV